MNNPVRTICLASSPQETGLWCGFEGLSFNGHALLEKTEIGFSPLDARTIQDRFDQIFGETVCLNAEAYLPRLASVARALNKGDLPLAMIGSVLLKLPDTPQFEVGKLAFDDTELRDELGRWTTGGAHEAKLPVTPETRTAAPAAAEAETEIAAEEIATETLAPDVVGLLVELAGILAAPITLAAGTLIPTNKSNIHYGEFPEFPELHYRSDEGVVTISRLDTAGNIETLYQGMPDKEGFYHDKDGYIVGQAVGTGVMFDNEALKAFVAQSAAGGSDDGGDPPAASADDSDKREACPSPTPENTKGRSNRSLAYQEQITGLPRGFDVNYLGVRFDGCDEDTGRMIEAKGLGMEWMLRWPPKNFYQTRFYTGMMRQAARQNYASEGRGDDYYFASEAMANFFGIEFRKAGYSNIRVHYVEANVKKILIYLGFLPQIHGGDCPTSMSKEFFL